MVTGSGCVLMWLACPWTAPSNPRAPDRVSAGRSGGRLDQPPLRQGAVLVQPGDDIGEGLRRAVQEALADGAAGPAQPPHLGEAFDPLGDDLKLQGRTHQKDRLDESGGPGA